MYFWNLTLFGAQLVLSWCNVEILGFGEMSTDLWFSDTENKKSYCPCDTGSHELCLFFYLLSLSVSLAIAAWVGIPGIFRCCDVIKRHSHSKYGTLWRHNILRVNCPLWRHNIAFHEWYTVMSQYNIFIVKGPLSAQLLVFYFCFSHFMLVDGEHHKHIFFRFLRTYYMDIHGIYSYCLRKCICV